MVSASIGANKQREWWSELALFTAWHVAAFNSQAKAGKLQGWGEIRRKFLNVPEAQTPVDWRARKAERKAQMDQRQKHQAARKRPIRLRPNTRG